MSDRHIDATKVQNSFLRLTFETDYRLWRPRCIYTDPEVLIAEDETGELWRIAFIVGWEHSICFAEPQRVEKVSTPIERNPE